ncbi:MAG: fibronectin type III domain-containing protein, partial [Ruminococcaceae bacterium]|nr:fibronectin type III domain-containing protein [Oscillospiraceae bacterium]
MKMIKKTAIILAVMLTLAMCFAFGASAEGELAEGAFTYTVANGKATIVKVDTSAEDGLFVPAELGGYPVDSIASDAFEGCDSLLTVHFCGTQGEWDIICAGNDVLAGKTLHLAEKVAGVPAKCEETGLTEGVRCAACDKWFTEQSEIPVLGHSFTDYQPDGNATILADGTKTAYCDNGCGEWDTLPDEGSKIVFGKPESVTSVTTTSSITLNWTPVEGATGYRVFYKTASGWKKCTTLTATTHSFYKLKPASKYTFAVRAYNLTDGVVTWAPTYTTHETASQAVAPAKITVAQNTNAIRLNWTACPGATGYRIYYKLPSDASWKV